MSDVMQTQVRMPKETWDYITAEAERLGIAKNAVLIMLTDMGRTAWEARKVVSHEGQ